MNFDIERIAKLAALQIKEEEKEEIRKKMDRILSMVAHLPDLEQQDNLLEKDAKMKLREDVVGLSTTRDALLGDAPNLQAGCVVVPKIMD